MKWLRFLALAAAALAACGAHAQISLRNAASGASDARVQHINAGGSDAANGCTTISPTTPAGLNGDLLIALVASGDSQPLTPSANWNTLLANNPVANLTSRIYWRFADGSPDDNLTVTKGGAGCNVMIGQMARFRYVDQANPFDTGQPIPGGNCTGAAPRVKCSYQNANTITTGTETTVTANAMLIYAILISDNNATDASGLGFTESFDSGTGLGNDAQVALNFRQETTAGVKGPFSVGKGGGSDPNHGVLFALRPSTTTLTVATPTGTQAGDVMVAAIAVQPSTVMIATPAGWNALPATVQGAGNSSRQQFFWRAAVAGEAASHTWTLGAAHTGAVGGIVSYFGADPAAPINISGGNATPVGGDTNLQHRAQSVTTTTGNAMVISAHSFASAETWAPPGGMTERVDVASIATGQAAGISLAMNEVAQPAAGATGDKIGLAAGNGDNGVAQILALKPAPVYFEIQSASDNVACAAFPIEVSITARDGATGAVLPGFVNLVNLSTTTATGDWSVGSANGALNNGAANDGAATYQFVAADQGRIVLRLAVTAVSTLRVRVQDSVTSVTSEGANINFIADGYVIAPDPVQVAGRPQTITVTRYNSCTQSQGQGHNGNNDMRIWLTLDSSHPGAATLPGATGGVGNCPTVNPLPTAEPGATNCGGGNPGIIRLSWSGGQVSFTLNTSDVGKYSINIADAGTTARRGSSPRLTERPFALGFPGIQHGVNENSLPILAAAGDNFSATVSAYLWAAADDGNNDGVPDAGANVTDNALAPRFAWDTTLSTGAILPATGTPGTLTLGGATPTIAQASFAGGSATPANVRYSEVGNVFLNATASNFLNTPGATVSGNSGLDGSGAAGGYVGRFRPKHFALSAGVLTNRVALGCTPASGFTYMDEGLRLAFTLTAQNAQNGTTVNYTGVYAKLGLTTFANYNLGARGTGPGGAANLTGRVDGSLAPTGTWSNGAANVTIDTAIRRATPDNPDGPYTGTAFGIAPVDSDTTGMNAFNLDVDLNAVDDHTSIGPTTEVRFGRLRLQNALGSEKLALPVPIQTQYWSGTGFSTNTLDSCTTLPRDTIELGSYTGNLTPAPNCVTFVQQNPVTFANGVGTLSLAAPVGAVAGSVLLTPNLGATATGAYCTGAGVPPTSPAVAAGRSYLLGRWNDTADPDGNANTAYDDKPFSRAAFGLYGAQPNNFIYFRENY